jgi:hypothetical protein
MEPMDTPDDNLQELLAQLDPTTRTLVAEVDLGEQAKEFMHSDLGRFMIGAAKQEIILAQSALAKVYPWRWRKVQELQNKIWRANFFLALLRELLISGKSAASAIEESETENG